MYQLTDYDYALPEELISQNPTDRRDASRLMTMNRISGDLGKAEHLPAPWHLLLLTRREPGFELGPLRAAGRLLASR